MKFLLNPSHGGMTFGKYLTPGKRSPQVPPGVYEGEFTRSVCTLIQAYNPEQIEITVPGPIRVPLAARVEYVNQVVRKFSDDHIALISVHANAARGSGWSPAHGFKIFHSRRASKNSLHLADELFDSFDRHTDLHARPIGEVNHTITTRTHCPAVLVECGFMTSEYDAPYLASPTGRRDIAKAIWLGMLEYANNVV